MSIHRFHPCARVYVPVAAATRLLATGPYTLGARRSRTGPGREAGKRRPSKASSRDWHFRAPSSTSRVVSHLWSLLATPAETAFMRSPNLHRRTEPATAKPKSGCLVRLGKLGHAPKFA